MSNDGPQEDAYALFVEKTFMLSSFIYAIGYGAFVRPLWLKTRGFNPEQACNLSCISTAHHSFGSNAIVNGNTHSSASRI